MEGKRKALVFGLLICLAFGAWAGGDAEAGGAAAPGTIRNPDTFIYASYGTVDSLDPAKAYDNASGGVIQNIYEPLVDFKGSSTEEFVPVLAEEVPTAEATSTFRDKFKAKLRATDGHFVRSRAEMLIDNWLYMAEVVHAYERKLPIEEEVYCDFYIPSGKIYIEYWGYENDAKYLQRKAKKQEIYAKHGFKLIELEDKDIENLDDVLPRMLLKFGVETS